MIQLAKDFEATNSTKLRYFKWPMILAAFTALSFAGALLGGIGPCGGPGVFFIIPFFICGVLTIVSLIVGIFKAIQNGRTAHEN